MTRGNQLVRGANNARIFCTLVLPPPFLSLPPSPCPPPPHPSPKALHSPINDCSSRSGAGKAHDSFHLSFSIFPSPLFIPIRSLHERIFFFRSLGLSSSLCLQAWRLAAAVTRHGGRCCRCCVMLHDPCCRVTTEGAV